MIVVSGTKRSGTSMWMQILAAAGLPWIGEEFPRDWEERYRQLNPRGFYESSLMAGIYYRSNPNPQTGAYLSPEATRAHAVKVFIPGLIRSDVAFIDRCIATVRPWREYAASIQRLNAAFGVKPPAPRLPPALTWWMENYALIRDIATRRYPAHVVSYAAVLDDPQRHISEVLAWIGTGNPKPAMAVVAAQAPPTADAADAGLSAQMESDADVDPSHIARFDELYDVIHRGQPLDDGLISALNTVQDELAPQIAAAEQNEFARTLMARMR
ncbi:MAG: hypothetical protein B7733_12705 [Myxococcales bacterium FL481]|nr:MAG: hypothetical protein B7733_12705 [Myxococcales bacterium FL481]